MEISGNNSQTQDVPVDNKAALEARLQAYEAQPADVRGAHTVVGQNATEPAQTQGDANPPQEKAPEDGKKADDLQQFRDKDGNVDEDKIRKSTEYLRKGTDEKKAKIEALVRENKEALREFTKTSQEAKRVEQVKPVEPDLTVAQKTVADSIGDQLPHEFEEQFKKDLEKNPVHAIAKWTKVLVDQAVRPIRSEWEMSKDERRHVQLTREIEDIADEGHDWVLTEGLGKFNEVFKQRPYLLQSPTPYKDALRFLDLPSKRPAAPAQGGPKTPILGAGHAVPPPSTLPPATAETELNSLSVELDKAIKMRDMKRATEIEEKMDRVHFLSHGRKW